MDPELTAIEEYLRRKDKVLLADALLKFQQDAGNTYQSDVVSDCIVPEGITTPSVESLTQLLNTIYQAVSADKEMQRNVQLVAEQLDVALLSQSKHQSII